VLSKAHSATALAIIRVEWRIYKVAEAILTQPWRSNMAPDRSRVGGGRQLIVEGPPILNPTDPKE